MPTTNTYTQFYQCTQNTPLGCQNNQETIEKVPNARFCLECGFPTPLSAQVEIRGTLGTYRISELLRPQGIGRLYRGIQIGNSQPVAVKEYLLPNRCFNPTEADQRRTTLLQITQDNLNNQKAWEFRLVSPSEVTADPSSDRIYLIFPGQIAASPTLTQVVREKGAFSATQVRVVLNQILQTLHFLHSQNLGTAHGNLGLDSLLMSRNNYVYACDLAAWEQHFVPGSIKKMPSPAQDLIDLGWVAFSLWTGQAILADSNAMLDPREDRHWSQEDQPLKDFLHRLLGLDIPFESAAEARQTLLKLPQPQNSTEFQVDRSSEPDNEPKFRKYWLLSLLALPILGGLLWLLPRSMSNVYAETSKFKHLLPSFADVNGIQPGQYPYTGERLGTWSTILDKQPVSDRQFRELLTQPKTDVAATFDYHGYHPQRSPLDEVLKDNGKANFAIASLVTQLPSGIMQETVAYDGLLVYVPAYKSQNLPNALQGKISLAQLKQIFTGQIVNWRQLEPDFPDLLIKPYRPVEPEAIRLFEQKVLDNDPHLIAQFRKIESRSTFNTLRSIAPGDQQAQKTEAGTISFGLLAQTWDQCKVYPLALIQGSAPPVQPLQRETTYGALQPISPTDNLCQVGKKFLPDILAFSTAKYPLSAPVVVAYPLDNNLPGHQSGPLFAQFLKTQDGQYLLQQAGIVPLQPIPKNHLLSPSVFNR